MTYGPDKVRAGTATILVVAALASTLLATGSVWIQRTIVGEKTLSGKVLPDFAADMPQIGVILIEIAAGPYSLVRQGSGWVMPERDNYPIAPDALANLAKGLTQLTYVSARTSDPRQFARLGVDKPSRDSDGVLLSLKGATNQMFASLYIGQMADAAFVRMAGKNDVFEARGELPDLTRPASWLDLKVLDITAETIASVSGQRVGEARFDIVRRPDGGFAPVGGQANVTATTAAIALTKWAPLDVIAASTLTSDPVASYSATLKSGVLISVTAYQENGRNWVILSAADTLDPQSDTAAKLNKRTDGWAFELNATDFSDLTFPTSAILLGPDSSQPQ